MTEALLALSRMAWADSLMNSCCLMRCSIVSLDQPTAYPNTQIIGIINLDSLPWSTLSGISISEKIENRDQHIYCTVFTWFAIVFSLSLLFIISTNENHVLIFLTFPEKAIEFLSFVIASEVWRSGKKYFSFLDSSFVRMTKLLTINY